MDNKKVLVIGSLNMDMTVKVDKLPKEGETVFGYEYYESCGGKGGNQAVAISRMEVYTEMLGMVGNDSYGKRLIDNLEKYDIACENVAVNENSVTGRAVITVDSKGRNSIVVIPGSNFEITVQDIEERNESIRRNDIVVLQNEIPMEVTKYILKKSKEMNKMTVYNPVPAKMIDKEMAKNIDYLVLNETEMEEIFKISISDEGYKDKILKIKQENNMKNIILTLGEKGSILFNEEDRISEFDAYKVSAVDTTAAGDSFLGGFIAEISKGKKTDEAIRYATAVSAITVTRRGAQDSIPSRDEVEIFLKSY